MNKLFQSFVSLISNVFSMDTHRRTRSRRMTVLVILCYGNFWNYLSYSMIAPFFSKEAEAKGVSASVYGLIYSIYHVMYLVGTPIYTRHVSCYSPTHFLTGSLIIESVAYYLFGLCIFVPSAVGFVLTTFTLRMINGLTSAIFITANLLLVTKHFPDKVISTLTIISVFSGLGNLAGPTVGGALYQLGGFTLPFVISGSFQLIAGILSLLFMPIVDKKAEDHYMSYTRFIMDKITLLDGFIVAVVNYFLAFNVATLEPHLRRFQLTPVTVGAIFIINGIVYGLVAQICAKLCDRGFNQNRVFCLVGSLLSLAGFVFVGPQVFVPFRPHLWLIIPSLVLIGLGSTIKLISSFDTLMKESVTRRGFPEDIRTYSMVSAYYLSAYSIGSIAGSSFGTFLYDNFGYRWASLLLFVLEALLTFSIIAFYARKHKRQLIPVITARQATDQLAIIANENYLPDKYRQSVLYMRI